MTNKDVYKIWAPTGKKWVDWVRPVPFLSINSKTPKYTPEVIALPYISQLDASDKSTAIIVDLPDEDSVDVGILLAKQGFRPIPIFNGVIEQKGSRATMDNHSISSAILWGTPILSETELADDAPPAFLTDADRLNCFRLDRSIYDNSWDVYHQDLPSEEYLLANGIKRIVVICNFLARDLKEVFAEYTKKEIEVYWTNGYNDLKRHRIRRF